MEKIACLFLRDELRRRVHITLADELPHRGSSSVILNFVSAYLPIFRARDIFDGESARSYPRHVILDSEHILPRGNSGETHFAPVLA